MKKVILEDMYKIYRSNIFIIITFAVLSILSSSILLHANFVGFAWDLYFHYSRIYEIKYSFMNGNSFPIVSLNKFYQNGSALMTLYPKVNIIPIVLLSFFVKSFVHLVYLTFILRNFLSLLVSYFSCYKFIYDKKISVLFSVSYTFSSLVLFYSFTTMYIGITSSLIFLPTVLFGCLGFIRDGKWIELTIGISFIICSHVINTLMSIILVLIFLIINTKKISDKHHLKLIYKATIVISLLSSFYWIPFVILNIKNKISLPIDGSVLRGLDYNTFVSSVFNNQPTECITIVALIGVVLSIINYRTLSLFSKQMFWVSTAIILISTSFFPWNVLNSTLLREIFQRSSRLFIFPQLLLCYLFAENLILICKSNKSKLYTIIISACAIMMIQFTGQREIVDAGRNNQVNSAANINTMENGVQYYTDYFPKNSLGWKYQIINHQVYYDDNRKSKVKLLGNGRFEFKLDEYSRTLKMPFLIYNGINYQVKLDGNNYKFYSDKHSQLTINNVNKGKHTVQVIVHKSWYDYLSYVLRSLGVVILLYSLIKEYWLKRKNE